MMTSPQEGCEKSTGQSLGRRLAQNNTEKSDTGMRVKRDRKSSKRRDNRRSYSTSAASAVNTSFDHTLSASQVFGGTLLTPLGDVTE
jgi:hypothetical protein